MGEQDTKDDLFEGRGRAVLQLWFLRLQLLLHVLDVACQTMAVEVVVAGCLGEGLLLLCSGHRARFRAPSGPSTTPGFEETLTWNP